MEFLIDSSLGNYIIFDSIEDSNNNLLPVSVTVKPEQLHPGAMTTMGNLFKRPIEFLGLLKDRESKVMLFKFAHEKSLFDERIYCDCYFLISETKLFKKFNELWGRDFNYINGVWK